MTRRIFIALALSIGFIGFLWTAPYAGAAGFTVKTCQSVSGSGVGPVPIDVSTGSFTAETGCHLGTGGQIGYRLQPTNQGSGQQASRTQWAGLQWQVPSGVSLSRAWAELGGTSANGSGSGFGTSSDPWMFRTFGLGSAGVHLFASRFSVPKLVLGQRVRRARHPGPVGQRQAILIQPGHRSPEQGTARLGDFADRRYRWVTPAHQ